MNVTEYDAVVIGAGQSGVPLAKALARSGKKTALVEREHVGGTCLNKGCTPTKTMIASARAAYLARRTADYGVQSGPVSVDMAQVRARKREIVKNFVDSSEKGIRKAGVEIIFGEGRFCKPASNGKPLIEVKLQDGQVTRITAGLVFIDTGARPAIPDLPGLNDDGVSFYDSTSIMELDHIPEHLLVLGGGYVGLEFGQMFRRFGSQVTIVQRGGQLLAREDSDVAEAIAEILRQDGIEIVLDSEADSVKKAPNGKLEMNVRTPKGESNITASHLLVATGRTPNVETLDLAEAGIVTGKGGFIQVNERLETNVPGVYALGDVKGGPAFTHISYDDYRIICANVLKGEVDPQHNTLTGRMIPYVVFTDPQLGRVGLSESEAREQGRKIEVKKIPMNYVARATEVGETRGLMKAIVDAENGQILGCAILGIEGGEIMAMIQIAMMGNLPYRVLRDAIFAHPTLAEGLNTLFS